jgi:hypothetical protein
MKKSMLTADIPAACALVADLLPWHGNGTLAPQETRLVDEHVSTCASCAALLRLEYRVLECIRAPRDNVEHSPQASWQQLLPHLEQESVPADLRSTELVRRTSPKRIPLRRSLVGIALTAQAAAIVILTVLVVHNTSVLREARFHTLGSTVQTVVGKGPLVRVAFTPGFDSEAVERWARAHGCRILAGPTRQNVYTVVLDSERETQRVIESMRSDARVLLAEPVAGY